MPYSNENLPPQCKGMTATQKSKFVKIVNAMLKEGTKEDIAIPTAIKKAKEFSEEGSSYSDFFEGQWVEVFRAGKQTDSAGNTRTWTEKDLEKIVSKYNSEENPHEAPLVIGHPKDNSPAFGWVEKLKVDGGVLYAQFNQLVPEFVEAVKQGLYKKRSISLYQDLTLRHIGFLGAMPPAVKGLKDIKFNESEDFSDYEFDECYKFQTIARIFQNLRDKLIEKDGIEEADKIISPWMVEDIKRQEESMAKALYTERKGDEKMPGTEKTVEQRIQDLETSFNEKVSALETKNVALEATNKELSDKVAKFEEAATKKSTEDPAADHSEEDPTKAAECGKGKGKPKKSEFEEAADSRLKALETQLAISEKKNRVAEYKEFANELVSAGKLVADKVNSVVDLMEAVHEVGNYNFAEGEKDVLAVFKEYLSAQPQIVQFGETDTNSQKQKGNAKASDQLADKASALVKEKKISYTEALAIAQEENPDLAQQAFAEVE
jgi:uncharacterized protein YdaT/uncharacterized coiled-coil protein SlyX